MNRFATFAQATSNTTPTGPEQEPERAGRAYELLLERPHDRTVLLDQTGVARRSAEALRKSLGHGPQLAHQFLTVNSRSHAGYQPLGCLPTEADRRWDVEPGNQVVCVHEEGQPQDGPAIRQED